MLQTAVVGYLNTWPRISIYSMSVVIRTFQGKESLAGCTPEIMTDNQGQN